MPAHKIPLAIRFWAKVDKSGDCWIWTGAKHPFGYGHIKVDGAVVAAHRVAYEMQVGAVPDGMVLDHLCRQPSCVNVAHLEVVTSGENTMRGNALSGRRKRQTHCKRDHEFTEENTYCWRTSRICRTCARDRQARAN